MKKMTAILLVLCLLLSLTGCGGSSKNYSSAPAVRQEAAEAPMAEAMASDSAAGLTSANSSGSTALPENRKRIITVDMNAETEDLDALQAALDETIRSLDGYVEDQSIYNGSQYATRRYRHANLTVRVPAEKVNQFTSSIAGLANVTSTNLRREDVTLTYVATESRVKALETEQARLLELMEQAETMADLLEIEARLTDVRYELERYASQLRTYDNQINYATIYLSIEEVQEFTPVEDPTLWERITTSFSGSLKGLGNSLQNLLVFLIAASPYLLVYGFLALIIVLPVKRIIRRRKAKKAAPQQENTSE